MSRRPRRNRRQDRTHRQLRSQLLLPRGNLIRVNVELLGKLRRCPIALDGGKKDISDPAREIPAGILSGHRDLEDHGRIAYKAEQEPGPNAPRPGCSRATRPGASLPTSPSCRSCCAGHR